MNQIAKVYELHSGNETLEETPKAPATWDDVRAEYGKMTQMGYQAVMQMATVGEMLIELKKETPHGEFLANVKRSLCLENEKAVPMIASTLMRFAINKDLLAQHQPQSQIAALALIKEHRPKKDKKPKTFKVGWAKVLHDRLGIYGNRVNRASLEKRLGPFPSHFIIEAEADAFVEKYIRIIGAPQEKLTRADLNAAQQKKLDTAIKIELIRLQELFKLEVAAEVERRCAMREARCDELEDKAIEREAQCAAAMAKIDSYMTEDEYRFILNTLHSDRVPEDRRERFDKAFKIFKRLETYVIRTLPLSVLRERGWAR